MNRLATTLANLIQTMNVLRLDWALVGGLAVSARAEPRFTRDIDIVAAVEDDSRAEQAIQALIGQGYQVFAIVEQEQTDRLATVRLVPHDETERGVVVDILFASSGIEQEIIRLAEPLDILTGIRVPVARPGHLLALKILSRDDRTRPQDLVDIRHLLEVCGEEEITLARRSVELITARDFHRGRNLFTELNMLLQGN